MKRLLLTIALVGFVCLLPAQTRPKMKFITGGTTVLGGGYNYAIKDYYMVLVGQDSQYNAMTNGQVVIGEVPWENVKTRQVTVANFLLAETEVTNLQYREFLLDSLLTPTEVTAFKAKLKKIPRDSADLIRKAWEPIWASATAAAIMPDTNCWASDFKYAYNEPLVKHYLSHHAFDQYPVVGVSWDQAHAYCEWLTRVTNQARVAQGKPESPAFRLPTEAEWEFAARAKDSKDKTRLYTYNFPWEGYKVIGKKGEFLANIKTGNGDYVGDNYEYTAPVTAFEPNQYGLYQMAGNVSEWCEDVFIFHQEESWELDPRPDRRIRLFEAADVTMPTVAQRVVKGGSWAEMYYAAMCGSRMGWPQTRGGSRIGFRVAQIITGDPKSR